LYVVENYADNVKLRRARRGTFRCFPLRYMLTSVTNAK
jgi:hypothetical protein